jgi:maltooligosyltrehalose synthase
MPAAAVGIALIALLFGVWGVCEGRRANSHGRALTAWAEKDVVNWARHTTWHDHQADTTPGDSARRDHVPPPPPPPVW